MLVTIGIENHGRESAILRKMFAARKSVFIDLLKLRHAPMPLASRLGHTHRPPGR